MEAGGTGEWRAAPGALGRGAASTGLACSWASSAGASWQGTAGGQEGGVTAESGSSMVDA